MSQQMKKYGNVFILNKMEPPLFPQAVSIGSRLNIWVKKDWLKLMTGFLVTLDQNLYLLGQAIQMKFGHNF